ncbi:MAG: hypothetical protein ACNS60_14070 [Candidatus Cyclobacteriaceae bacterium M2_1C_046]
MIDYINNFFIYSGLLYLIICFSYPIFKVYIKKDSSTDPSPGFGLFLMITSVFAALYLIFLAIQMMLKEEWISGLLFLIMPITILYIIGGALLMILYDKIKGK